MGQCRDFTALAVLERAELRGDWDLAMFAWRKVVALRLRYLERMPLGTPYPEIAKRVAAVTQSRQLARQCHLVVDGTGVGRPVVDLLKRERPDGKLMPVTITSGDAESMSDGYYRIPKRDLIAGLQVLLQRGELQIAAGLQHAEALANEMAEMQVKVSAAGNEQYGAWREGTHDDLVFAVALACWGARKAHPNPPQGEDQWWTNPREADAARAFQEATRSLREAGRDEEAGRWRYGGRA